MSSPTAAKGSPAAAAESAPSASSPPPTAAPTRTLVESTDLVADDTLEGDTFDDGDSAVGSDSGSDTASLTSSVMRYRQENGRTYHGYKDGSYVLPNDDYENQRLDLQHNLLILTFGEELYLSPLKGKPVGRVLDAGCGTGIWAIDFADEHPEAQVTGVDLSPIQPGFVPPNVTFFVDDLADEWNFSSKFDFIFTRFMTGSIQDWPKYFERSFENLNPGGWIEMQDIIYPMTSDDGTLLPDSPLRKWSELLLQGFTNIGRPLNTALEYKQQLADAGFTDITEYRAKWPTNVWPRDIKHKQIGLWVYQNALDALSALSLAVFTRPEAEGGLGWRLEELEVLLAAVRKDLKNPRIHAYWPMYAVYAKRPE